MQPLVYATTRTPGPSTWIHLPRSLPEFRQPTVSRRLITLTHGAHAIVQAQVSH